MKVRLDFVSNSSTSSFAIVDAKAFIRMFSEDFANVDFAWEFAEKISVHFSCKERDAAPLEKYFNDVDYVYKPYYDYDYEHKWKIELDDSHEFCGVSLPKLTNCRKDIIDKIDSKILLYTTEENDEFGKMMLRLLMRYCKHKGIDVDDSTSEIRFNDEKDDFFTRLFNVATEENKKDNI